MFRINYSSEPKDFACKSSALMIIDEGLLWVEFWRDCFCMGAVFPRHSLSTSPHFWLFQSAYCPAALVDQGNRGLTQTVVLCFFVQVMVPGSQNNLLLKSLLSDTEYKVTVTPIYDDGEGVSVSAPGKTCESNFLPVDTSWLIKQKCSSPVIHLNDTVYCGEKSERDLVIENLGLSLVFHTFKLRDSGQVA